MPPAPLVQHSFREPCLIDAIDDDWAFIAPYLTMLNEDTPSCCHDLGEVFNAPGRG